MTKHDTLPDSRLCCGCGTCAAICPRSAVSMVVDRSKGVYIPLVDDAKCSQCGLCAEVCPGIGVDFRQIAGAVFPAPPADYRTGYYYQAYLARSADPEIRYRASSGGLITSMLLYMLETGIIDGALVSIVEKGNPLVPQPHIASTAEEIHAAAKSKYCPIPANTMLKNIIGSSPGKRFAVIGLPCHFHGLRKLEAQDKTLTGKIVLRIGLFCEACPTFSATEFFIRHHGMNPAEIVRFEYRGGGWPGRVLAETAGGKQAVEPFQDVWSVWKRGFLSPRCAVCIDKANELADISVADPWCLVENENTGSSLALVRIRQAEDILTKMEKADRINLQPVTDTAAMIKGQGYFDKKQRASAEMKVSGWLGAARPVYISADALATGASVTDLGRVIYRRLLTAIARQRWLWPLMSAGIPPAAVLLKYLRKAAGVFR